MSNPRTIEFFFRGTHLRFLSEAWPFLALQIFTDKKMNRRPYRNGTSLEQKIALSQPTDSAIVAAVA